MSSKKKEDRVILNHTNFEEWKTDVHTRIKTKGGYDFIQAPTNLQYLSAMETRTYYKVLNIICHSIDADLRAITKPTLRSPEEDDCPHRLWNAIMQWYLHSTPETKHSAKANFFSICMRPDEDMQPFLGRLSEHACLVNDIVDQLNPGWRASLANVLNPDPN